MHYSWITIVNGCTQRTKFKCINLIVYRIPFTWHLRSFLWKVPIVLCCPSFSAGIRLGKCEWTLSFRRSTRCSERKSPGPRAIPSERWKVPSEARSAWSLSFFHPSWWLSKFTNGCFLKWWYPQVIHFNRVFHIINHPFWGTTIFGNTQIEPYSKQPCRAFLVTPASSLAPTARLADTRPWPEKTIKLCFKLLAIVFSENGRMVGGNGGYTPQNEQQKPWK